MRRASCIDSLSHCFREMSFERDRILNENGVRPQANSDESSNAAEGPKEWSSRSMQDAHSDFPREGRFNVGATWNKGPHVRCRTDLLDDKDSVFSLSRRCRSLPKEYNASGARLSETRCGFPCRWITGATEKDHVDTQALHTSRHDDVRETCSFAPFRFFSNVQPSSFFVSLVKAVAERRGVPFPPIPQEVAIAYEKHVRCGTPMLKFIAHGAPHKRFFVVKFLDHKTRRRERAPVLCWYRDARSRTMRRYLFLSDLVAVILGGDGHPAIQRRRVGSHLIKGCHVDMSTTYLEMDWILQWRFNSSSTDEVLAVKLLSKQSFIAWYIVSDFFSRIGSAALSTTLDDEKFKQ